MVLMVLWDHMVLTECLMDLMECLTVLTMNMFLMDHIMNMFLMDHTVQCLMVLTDLTDSWDPISALLTTTVLIWNQNTCDTTAKEVK
jgi:hypothetical protein